MNISMTTRVIKKYRLEGHYAGKTVKLGDFSFVNGELTAAFTEPQHEKLARHLSQWRAVEVKTDGKRNLQEASPGALAGGVQPNGEGTAASDTTADSSVTAQSEASDGGDGVGAEGDGQEEELSKEKVEEHPQVRRIREALLSLDPGTDAHWTQAGKPALQAVEAACGFAGLTRAMLDAVAQGYNRTVAATLAAQRAEAVKVAQELVTVAPAE